MQTLSVDDVFDITGHFGYSQLIYFFSLGSLQLFIALHMLLSIFLDFETPFTCLTKNLGILYNECPNNKHANCEHIDYNLTSFKSVANEWNFICEEKFKLPMIQSVWMGGVMAGALFLGGLADKIGRMMTLMIFLLCMIGFEAFSAFSPNYIFLLTLRFLGGASCSLVILSSVVIIQELIGTSKRSVACLLMSIFFSAGIGLLALMASVIQEWRTLTLVCSLSGIIFTFIPCVVPESPRWLLGVGEVDKAKHILEYIARKNGKFHLLPPRWELASSLDKKKDAKGGSVLDLFTHSYMLMLTLIMIYSWFVNSASYYALTMAASSLPGSIYVSTTLNGLVEVPAMVIGVFLINGLGRRLAIFSSMVCSGLACLAIPFLPPGSAGISISALTGKLCISASFGFIYIHSGEIFPTVIRNTGLSIVSVAARVGGILSPFILSLKDVYPNLQFILLGILALVAGFLNLKLPETFGRPMPESIADIINMKDTKPKLHVKKASSYARLKQEEDDQSEDLLRESTWKQNIDSSDNEIEKMNEGL